MAIATRTLRDTVVEASGGASGVSGSFIPSSDRYSITPCTFKSRVLFVSISLDNVFA